MEGHGRRAARGLLLAGLLGLAAAMGGAVLLSRSAPAPAVVTLATVQVPDLDELVSVRTPADVARIRSELLEAIFGTPAIPWRRLARSSASGTGRSGRL